MSAFSASSPGGRIIALVTGLLTALALSLGVAPTAHAHNTLVSSSPEDGATLDSLPEKVVLTFNAEVLEGGNGIVVTGPDGTNYASGDVVIDGVEASIDLEPLTQPGEYTVEYRIISADGHPLSDTFTFTVDESAIPEPTESPAAEQPEEEEPTPAPAETEGTESEDSTSTTGVGLSGPLGAILGIVLGIGVIAVIAITIIRLRRRPGSGD
ncbi:hypothetical protein JCM3263A_23700 [Thermobifida fusca]|jgi:methionine-rich copper-binding protein CopC|uniref:Cu resistance protein CopC n=2 Tax=Thermobifida fusca TaxID=2021 RepID=A0A9P2WRU9_THEFU|nr:MULTISPECIES: copper resistance CopC family protein [Thermobifida]AAZ54336.1 similar to Cu resistance protein CopC [Thermobifida fusca YX]EOR72555.1 Cu resistance protein CopC [Thermobifida fusca TM51]MBO2529803.1 copper resistance protein CopC [Thermobifida sp.]PPS95490.1 copper resistance protein CopC [Thermobifida fusca]PZN61432.1 MAG: copper resistance protein CopC [Thermobifida fusca]